VQRDFDDQLTEIVSARRFAADAIGDHARLDDALVVVSELATNAVRHARSRFSLSVDRDDEHLRIEVLDHGEGMPVMPVADRAPRDAPRSGGIGLFVVDALADRWGVVEQPAGKLVWAELDGG
jgi:anti-sigma regulatory factor (Ser/Thr protein kinase)